ncbi:hypothetical protein Ciccas_010526 [Cichlidogyrus casuarinus]|uniref:Uncharacterized protein n=1 Tax=Cichlidogyrus casuarinus TaxID=1844966 RepID=A0ABD2PUQ0_9PLAT
MVIIDTKRQLRIVILDNVLFCVLLRESDLKNSWIELLRHVMACCCGGSGFDINTLILLYLIKKLASKPKHDED